MINSPNNRLDEFVKQSLENYQVPFNEAHWNEFESKLGSQPRVNPFRKWNFSLNTIIGGMIILSAAAFIYAMTGGKPETKDAVTGNKNTVTINTPSTAPQTKTQVETTTTARNNDPGSLNNAHIDPFTFSIHNNSPYSFFTSSDLSNPDGANEKIDPVDQPNGFSFTSTNPPVMNTGTNDGQLNPQELQDALKNTGSTVVNNNIFPDQIDPLKGVVKSTKETDTMISKANNIPSDNDPLIQIGKNGQILSNPQEVLKTIKTAESKADSTKSPRTNENPGGDH
jgi:hypothetical protein